MPMGNLASTAHDGEGNALFSTLALLVTILSERDRLAEGRGVHRTNKYYMIDALAS